MSGAVSKANFTQHAQQIYEFVIVMHYLVKAANMTIASSRQCPIIMGNPEEHMRVRLGKETQLECTLYRNSHTERHVAAATGKHGVYTL